MLLANSFPQPSHAHALEACVCEVDTLLFALIPLLLEAPSGLKDREHPLDGPASPPLNGKLLTASLPLASLNLLL